jgi:hypothetical protein
MGSGRGTYCLRLDGTEPIASLWIAASGTRRRTTAITLGIPGAVVD